MGKLQFKNNDGYWVVWYGKLKPYYTGYKANKKNIISAGLNYLNHMLATHKLSIMTVYAITSHLKHPRTNEHFKEMNKKSTEAKLKKLDKELDEILKEPLTNPR